MVTSPKDKKSSVAKQGYNRADNFKGAKGKPWQPGQSGNPKGPPRKDICITSLVKELLLKDAGHGKTNADLVAEAIVKLATKPDARGHVPTIKELLDRLEGKVPTPVSIGGLGGGPVEIAVVYEDEVPKEPGTKGEE